MGPMADKFDAYREALVLEETTIWGDEYDHLEAGEKASVATALHADAEQCSDLAYVRTYTGFCRQITVTQEDLQRVSS